MKVQPYLFFDGRAEEAIEFYKNSVGAELMALMRFKDNPDPPKAGMVPPGSENKVMHMQFRIGETELMGSDGRCLGKPNFEGVSLAILASNTAEAERMFEALGEGGQVQMPMAKTFFSPAFGMVADKFGVSWMVVTDA